MARPGKLEEWRAVAGATALVEAASAVVRTGRVEPKSVAALHAIGPPALVPVALELVTARERARRRIEDAARLIADVEGVEQASGTRAARHKAARFAALAPPQVVDLCCGVGGDTIELAAALPDAEVVAVDVDPVRAWMTEHNAGCRSLCEDVESLDVHGAVIHVDPARRIEGRGKRLRRFGHYRPGPAVIARLAATARAGAIKLAPGVALDELPDAGVRELEVIGDDGGLVQAVLWCGDLAANPGMRTATRLETGETFSATPRPVDAGADGEIGAFVLVPDAALERAELVGARAPDGAREIVRGLGLLTAAAPLDDPWFRSFEVVDVVPWRLPKLRAALAAHDAGLVRVKTRGGVADANAAELALRGDGSAALWVLGFRIGPRAVGVIARERAARSSGP